MKNVLLWIFCLCATWQQLKGQNWHSDAFWEEQPQISLFNPSWQPADDNKLVVSLPSFNLEFWHNGPVFNDIAIQRGSQNEISLDAYNSLDAQKSLDLATNLRLQSFLVGWRQNHWYFQIDHSVDFGLDLTYPAMLPQLIWKGNADYVGQELTLDTRLESAVLSRLGFAVSRSLGKWLLGMRVQYIHGLMEMSTPNSHFRFETLDPSLALRFDTDYTLRSAGVIEYNGLEDITIDLSSFDRFGASLANSGWALNLGVQYEIDDKWIVGASIQNLGQVYWNEGIEIISSQVNKVYEGQEFETILGIENTDFDFDSDTVEAVLAIQTEDGPSYTTSLRARYVLHGRWQTNERLQLGGLVQLEQRLQQTDIDFTLWGNVRLANALAVGLSWGHMDKSWDRIGLQFQACIGPVAIYGSTYDIGSIFNIYDAQRASASLGVNLLF